VFSNKTKTNLLEKRHQRWNETPQSNRTRLSKPDHLLDDGKFVLAQKVIFYLVQSFEDMWVIGGFPGSATENDSCLVVLSMFDQPSWRFGLEDHCDDKQDTGNQPLLS